MRYPYFRLNAAGSYGSIVFGVVGTACGTGSQTGLGTLDNVDALITGAVACGGATVVTHR